MTRIFSFKMGRDASGRVYSDSGVNTGFHVASHHREQPDSIEKFKLINDYHIGMLPYFLEQLKSTMEGDSNLLDKSVVLYGSPMADSNIHNHRRCPLFLVGKGQGQFAGNIHIKAAPGTPMANAMLTVLRRLGLQDLASFGDSTGELSI